MEKMIKLKPKTFDYTADNYDKLYEYVTRRKPLPEQKFGQSQALTEEEIKKELYKISKFYYLTVRDYGDYSGYMMKNPNLITKQLMDRVRQFAHRKLDCTMRNEVDCTKKDPDNRCFSPRRQQYYYLNEEDEVIYCHK